MRQLRILLAGSPTLLLDSLHHIVEAETDMAVVGRVSSRDTLAAAKRMRADVVLVGQRDSERAQIAASKLVEELHLKVLTIADDGRTGTLYELRPQRIPLGEMSADALRAAIRGRQPRPARQAS